jgi:ribonuclease VapC
VIVLDTSALMAIVLDEPEADAVAGAIQSADALSMSAATVAEALIVARRRGVGEEMARLIDGLGADIVPATRMTGSEVADAYDRWGKGAHPAGLNVGDCFAYALARRLGGPLLYLGEHFTRTDVMRAHAP